jgi:integrase
VLAALAVSRWIEDTTGWSIKKFVKTVGREMRHSFVSVLSASGVRIEDISRLVGHSSTTVTETVYRHEILPVMQETATVMDLIFPAAS